jgi:hypothetical protein
MFNSLWSINENNRYHNIASIAFFGPVAIEPKDRGSTETI